MTRYHERRRFETVIRLEIEYEAEENEKTLDDYKIADALERFAREAVKNGATVHHTINHIDSEVLSTADEAVEILEYEEEYGRLGLVREHPVRRGGIV
mgnify:CR=1 FL=1